MTYKTRRREWGTCRRETVGWRKHHCGTCAPKRAGLSVLYNASRPTMRERRLSMDRRLSSWRYWPAGPYTHPKRSDSDWTLAVEPVKLRGGKRKKNPFYDFGSRPIERTAPPCMHAIFPGFGRQAGRRAGVCALEECLRDCGENYRVKHMLHATSGWTRSGCRGGGGREKYALAGPVRRVWASSGRLLPWSESDTWAVRTPAGYR